MLLGNDFPEEFKRKKIEESLAPGRVLYLHCDFIKPAKNKYLLLASTSQEAVVFVINSQINDFIKKRRELYRCQVKIGKKDHDFLDHDSYIACNEIKEIPIDDIRGQLEGDINRIKGIVSDDVKREVISATKFSETLTPREIQTIVGALQQDEG